MTEKESEVEVRLPDEFARTAYHEAGHAVAYTMRGGSRLRGIDVRTAHHGAATKWGANRSWDEPFISYAGPWAEAHYLASLDDDCDEDDMLVYVFFQQPADREVAYEHPFSPWRIWDALSEEGRLRALPELAPLQVEDAWYRELLREWPAIEGTAQLLIEGATVTDAMIRDLRA